MVLMTKTWKIEIYSVLMRPSQNTPFVVSYRPGHAGCPTVDCGDIDHRIHWSAIQQLDLCRHTEALADLEGE